MTREPFFNSSSRILWGRWVCLLLGVVAMAGRPFSLGLLFGPLAVWLGIQTSDPALRKGRKLALIGIMCGAFGFTMNLAVPVQHNSMSGAENWVGKPAPPFEWIDIDGITHRLEDYRGRRLFLVYWGIHCRPCLKEIPILKNLVETLPEDKFGILSISGDPGPWLEDSIEKMEINYPVITFSHPKNEAASPYREVELLPTLMVISPQGTFEALLVGALTEDRLRGLAENGA
jgi:peroxiredoxin